MWFSGQKYILLIYTQSYTHKQVIKNKIKILRMCDSIIITFVLNLYIFVYMYVCKCSICAYIHIFCLIFPSFHVAHITLDSTLFCYCLK